MWLPPRTPLGLVLVTVPAVLVGCESGDPCVERHSRVVYVAERPPPGLVALLDRCDADVDDCAALCERLLGATVGGDAGLVGCAVTLRGAEHVVTLDYTTDTGRRGCPGSGQSPPPEPVPPEPAPPPDTDAGE